VFKGASLLDIGKTAWEAAYHSELLPINQLLLRLNPMRIVIAKKSIKIKQRIIICHSLSIDELQDMRSQGL
jgi:hypothetical protein